MTRGVRAGETFEKVSPAPFQNFKTERLFRDARTKAVSSRKVSSTFFKWAAHKGIAFVHEFGAYAPNITGFGATPRESAFLLELFFALTRSKKSG